MTEEMVEFTIKVPKPIVDFLRALDQFTKCDEPLEAWMSQQIVETVVDLLEGNNLDIVIDGPELLKTYKIQKL